MCDIGHSNTLVLFRYRYGSKEENFSVYFSNRKGKKIMISFFIVNIN